MNGAVMEEKILFKEESYQIIGICKNIHSTLGGGFLEAVYSEVLEKEFKKNTIAFEKEKKLEIFSRQLQNYLKATNNKLGILINFGEKSLKYKRIINL